MKFTLLILWCCVSATSFGQLMYTTTTYYGSDKGDMNNSDGLAISIGPEISLSKGDYKKEMVVKMRPSLKYTLTYFKEGTVLDRTNNYSAFIDDPDTDHEYNGKLFSPANNLMTTSIALPIYIIRSINKWGYSLGLRGEYLYTGRYKNNYTVNHQPESEVIWFTNYADHYGVNPFQLTVLAFVQYDYVSVGCDVNVFSFFKKNQGQDIKAINLTLWVNFIKF